MNLTPQTTLQQCLLTATLLLYTGGALSQLQVQVPQGPLIRMAGSAVALWCNASRYPVKSFEWSLFPAHSPQQRLQIVSSADPDFSYVVYKERVSVSGEIYLEKVRNNFTRLHLTRLKAQDAGDYECYAPGTRYSYHGSHSANVRVTVIPDSLQVSLLSPETLTLHEDDAVSLTCQVLSGTEHHTHISISWYQGSMESAQPIANFSKHSITSVAAAYLVQHQASELQLEKVSPTQYQLTLGALQSTDDGHYYCQATEWIQDPDQNWYPLSSKRSRHTIIRVLAADRMSAVQSSTTMITHPRGLYILMLQLPLVAWAVY